MSKILSIAFFLFAAVPGYGCAPGLTRATDTIHPLEMSPGARVHVEHFALDPAIMPQKTDDWHKGWNVDLVEGMAEAIAAKLNAKGFQAQSVSAGLSPSKSDYTIRGHYVTIAGGSKGTRGATQAFLGGWAGDAGKAYLIMEGDVVDRTGKVVMTFYHKDVPDQNFVTDASGAFSDAIASTAMRFANEFEDRLDD